MTQYELGYNSFDKDDPFRWIDNDDYDFLQGYDDAYNKWIRSMDIKKALRLIYEYHKHGAEQLRMF